MVVGWSVAGLRGVVGRVVFYLSFDVALLVACLAVFSVVTRRVL